MAERVNYSFQWNIENYSSCEYEGLFNGPKSPIFTPKNFGGSKWYMRFVPPSKGKVPDNDSLFCYLYRNDIDEGDEKVTISFEFQIIGESGNVIYTYKSFSPKVFKRKNFTWHRFSSGKLAQDSLTWNKDILTIHCEMYLYTKQERPGCVARTKIEEDRASFIWEITLPESKSFLIGRIFSLSKTSMYEICAADAPNDSIELRIRNLKNGSSSSRLLNCKISFLNDKAEMILLQNVQYLFPSSDKNDVWVLPTFIARRTVMNDKRNHENCFTLLCEFSKPSGSVLSDIVSINDPDSMNLSNVLTMRDDLGKMFADLEHSDVELRAENMSLPAHKFLLSARSPVFRAMFHHQNMIENESNVVELSDVDPEILKSFLQFLYTGSVDIIDDESALELLVIADKYQVLSLKDTCSKFALSALSLKNACKILYLSDLLNLKLLRDNAADFIAKHFNEIFKSREWSDYIEKNSSLVSEILSYLMVNFKIVPKNTQG